MLFEWDESKRAQLLRERGFDLLFAARIFRGPVVTGMDERTDYGEVRQVSIGMVGDECFVVVHTERDGATRLITAWKAGRRARSEHQAGLAERDRGDVGGG